MAQNKLIISCMNQQLNGEVPVGFGWLKTMATQFRDQYRLVGLLHGDCLKYGLNNETYKRFYGTDNPFARYLLKLSKLGVKLKLCQLCAEQNSYPPHGFLKPIKLVNFSVDYLAQQQLSGAAVVYDYRPVNIE